MTSASKIGPKADEGSLGDDLGTYSYVIVGRGSDGKLAGVMVGAVEA